jgi:sulfur relay protein TusB/DsrH
MLHIIDHFPTIETLSGTSHGDTVLLKDNAVQAVRELNQDMHKIRKAFAHINLCVRRRDLSTRNIDNIEGLNGIAVLDELEYEAIVENEVAIRSWN